MKLSNRNSVLTIIGSLTLFMLLAAQIIPYSDIFLDHELIEVIDFEESESEKKNKEELEDEKEKYKRHELGDDSLAALISAADRCFRNSLPTPPFLETLSPPPDQI